MDISVLIQLLILLVLLFFSAFFSASETALISLNRIKVRHMVEQGKRNALVVQKLLHKPQRLLSTILVGNNIVNIGASALATSLAIEFFGSTGVGIATGVMTLLVLIFGEITPKSFAANNPEKISLTVAKWIELLGTVLSPLIKALSAVTNFIIRLLGGKVSRQGPFVTEEEIKLLVNVGQEEGIIEKSEKEMIDSIFEFDDTLVREVMVPRIDMVSASVDNNIKDILALIMDAGHSRIPIYEQTIDNIVGVVYAKDLLKYVMDDCHDLESLTIKEIMRPAYYVPESKKVRDLLAELRKEHIHMAIVLDEYGGTAGLVTIEDVIEEIIGDIQDEYDKEENWIEILDEQTAKVDARTNIDEVNEILEIDLPDDEFDTIGGLVYHLSGKIPREGQELDYDGIKFIVEKVSGRRVIKVKVWKKQDVEVQR